MGYETLEVEVRDKIATITLSRPDRGNALNLAMHRELRDVWDRVNDDDDIWAAVVTGAGDVFSVGDDIDELAGILDAGERPERWTELNRWQDRYRGRDVAWGIPEPSQGRPAKPLVAAVNGLCAGPAVLLAAHADFAIASETAEFALPQVTYGLAPIQESIVLSRAVMRPAMMRMALLGEHERLSAERARQLGLILETRPPGEMLDRVYEMLTLMNDWSAPLAVRGVKASVWRTINLHWDDAHRWGHMYLNEIRFHSSDAREGPRAFAEKRKPNWQAR